MKTINKTSLFWLGAFTISAGVTFVLPAGDSNLFSSAVEIMGCLISLSCFIMGWIYWGLDMEESS